MGARGRQPGSLAIVDNSRVLTMPRAKPPEELTDEEAEEWRGLTNRMPADYFGREHYSVLVQLCRHTIAARHLAETIKNTTELKDYLKLLTAQAQESRSIAVLARSLRLTHQANVRQELSRTPEITNAPWLD
jgi:DNA primase